MFDAVFLASTAAGYPYEDITGTATFNRPGGGTESIPLFWDGSATWRVRFSPDTIGAWSYAVSSSDSALNGASGSFSCVASTAKGAVKQGGAGNYHFVHQDGTPHFWMVDTCWWMTASEASENLNRTAVQGYINEQAAQGFTGVMMNPWRDAGNEGGSGPWVTLGREPNVGYWQEVDSRIAFLNGKDMVAVMLLGWNEDINALGTQARRERWARYVAARYSAYNTCFVMSGEWTEWYQPDQYRAMGAAFAAADTHERLLTVHSDGSYFKNDAWCGFSAFEQDDWTNPDLHGYMLGLRSVGKPCVLAEYAYVMKDAGAAHSLRNLDTARDKTWEVYMAGGYAVPGFGSTYRGGTRDVASFNGNEDGEADEEDTFAVYCGHLNSFFTSVDFTTLAPNDGLLSGGATRFCLADPGSTYLVYTRDSASSVSLSVPPGRYRWRRMDPRNGAWTGWTPTPTTTTSVSLTPGSSDDWAFVVELESVEPGPPAEPRPAHGAAGVAVDAELSWTPSWGVIDHGVYFGTAASPGAAEYQGTVDVPSFDPGALLYDTTYYWQVVENTVSGQFTGPVWSFSTRSPFTGTGIEVRGSGYAVTGSPGTSVALTAGHGGDPGNYLVVGLVSESAQVAAMTFRGVPMNELYEAAEPYAYLDFYGIPTSETGGELVATYSGGQGQVWGPQIFGYAFLDGVDTDDPVRATGSVGGQTGAGTQLVGYTAAAEAGDFALLLANQNGQTWYPAVDPADVTLYSGAAGSTTFSGMAAYDEDLPAGTYRSTFTFDGGAERELAGGLILASRAADPNADTDGDGIADWYEVQYSGMLTGLVATADEDGDGLDAFGEWLALTDPNDSNSVFRIQGWQCLPGTGPVLSWQSASGRVYGVQWRPDPLLPPQTLVSNLTATPPANTYTDAIHGAAAAGMYGLHVGRVP
jgi:hypothetical protein